MAGPDLWNRKTRSAAPGMSCPNQHPSLYLVSLCGIGGKNRAPPQTLLSPGRLYARWQVSSFCWPWPRSHHTATWLTRTPRHRSSFVAFSLLQKGGVGKRIKHLPLILCIQVSPGFGMPSLAVPHHFPVQSLGSRSLGSALCGLGGASFSITGTLHWGKVWCFWCCQGFRVKSSKVQKGTDKQEAPLRPGFCQDKTSGLSQFYYLETAQSKGVIRPPRGAYYCSPGGWPPAGLVCVSTRGSMTLTLQIILAHAALAKNSQKPQSYRNTWANLLAYQLQPQTLSSSCSSSSAVRSGNWDTQRERGLRQDPKCFVRDRERTHFFCLLVQCFLHHVSFPMDKEIWLYYLFSFTFHKSELFLKLG